MNNSTQTEEEEIFYTLYSSFSVIVENLRKKTKEKFLQKNTKIFHPIFSAF